MKGKRDKQKGRSITKAQTSAGGVVYKKEGEFVEVALVSTKRGKVWTLPKGLIGEGETPEQAALREVKEESGLTGKIVDSLGEIKYWYYHKEQNTTYRKTVHYFLMEYTSGSVKEHDWEVDEVAWFPIDMALSKVVYKGDKEILQRAKEKLVDEIPV